MEVRDIKDRAPNQELVEYIERLLTQARSGELRTLVTVTGWHDDSWSNGWVVDWRNTKRRMLGEMAMLNYDMLSNVALEDGNTAISRIS